MSDLWRLVYAFIVFGLLLGLIFGIIAIVR
jgi:hypothetical protein